MKLRVKNFRHTYEGETYHKGETFEGTEKLLASLPDRLESAEEPAKPEPEKAPAPEDKKPEPEKAPAKTDSKEPVKAPFDKKGG